MEELEIQQLRFVDGIVCLAFVSRRCPGMRKLSLGMTIDVNKFNVLDAGQPLWRLQSLSCDKLEAEGYLADASVLHATDRFMPCLTELEYQRRDRSHILDLVTRQSRLRRKMTKSVDYLRTLSVVEKLELSALRAK